MSNVSTRTLTEFIVSMDADRGLQARELIDDLRALNFALELFGAMAHPEETHRVRGRQNDSYPFYVARFHECVRVRSLHYGSPIEFVIDLPALIEFLENAGLVAFTALATKGLVQSAEAWKTLEEAMKLRRERKEAKRTQRRVTRSVTGELRTTSTETSEQRQADAGVEQFLEPLVRAIQEHSAEVRRPVDTDQARAAGLAFIEYREEEAEEAGRALKTKTIRIELH